MLDVRELLKKVEPLREELREFKVEVPGIGWAVNHPLVQMPFYTEQMNAMLNAQYEMKRQKADQLFDDQAWMPYVFLHERPHRWQVLLDVAHELNSPGEYFQLIASVLVDTENQWQNVDTIRSLLNDHEFTEQERAQWLMTSQEREVLAKMADEFTVYRGCQEGLNERGLSWTVDVGRAKWFATRFADDGRNSLVLIGKCRREDVIAYFGDRDEEEILIEPEHVKDLQAKIVRRPRQ